MKKILALLMALVICGMAMLPCSAEEAKAPLMMATTTSTDDTGLLDYLAPLFKKDTGIELKWTAVGTGKAMQLGQNCDVDVLLVHAPAAEKSFVEAGHGVRRTEVMFNDFVLIGPEADPAGVKGKSVAEALAAILARQAVFASRGDDSGTHKMELSLWKDAGLTVPDGAAWYMQVGQGMMTTINMAAERGGYTLTDRGTYITYSANLKDNPPLKILVEGDARLKNQYSVVLLNPAKCQKINVAGAEAFEKWLAGKQGQGYVRDFKLMGKQLFFPNAK
ncbi:MAG: substrate-binding domain-containing protein [Thermodesulfobacteriota bacterium]